MNRGRDRLEAMQLKRARDREARVLASMGLPAPSNFPKTMEELRRREEQQKMIAMMGLRMPRNR